MRLVPSLNQTKIDATEKKLNVRSLVMLRVYALASFQFFRLCQFNPLVPLIRGLRQHIYSCDLLSFVCLNKFALIIEESR